MGWIALDKQKNDCFLSPCDLYSIAGAISLLLYKEFNKCQLETILNLTQLIVANLDAIVAQIDINEGIDVSPNL